jgi:hypothetical protein
MIAVQQFADTAAAVYGACTDALLDPLDLAEFVQTEQTRLRPNHGGPLHFPVAGD